MSNIKKLGSGALLFFLAVTYFISGLVLISWRFHLPFGIQVSPLQVPMQFNTALLFFCGGIALSCLMRGQLIVPRALGLFIFSLSLGTLCQYLLDKNFGIDEVFVKSWILTETSHPGRMAPNTALSFVLLGIAIFLLSQKKRSDVTLMFVGLLGTVVVSFGFTSLMGYLLGVHQAYGWGSYSKMASHTAGLFLILGCSLILFAAGNSHEEQYRRSIPIYFGFFFIFVTFIMWQLFVRINLEKFVHSNQSLAASFAQTHSHKLEESLQSLERMAKRIEKNPSQSEALWSDDANSYLTHLQSILGLEVWFKNTRKKWSFPEDLGRSFRNSTYLPALVDQVKRVQRPIVSRNVELKDGKKGFLMVVPFWIPSGGSGFLLGAFSADIFFKNNLDSEDYVWAIRENDTDVVVSKNFDRRINGEWSVSAPIRHPSERWEFHMIPTHKALRQVESKVPLFILAGGILLSILIALLVRFTVLLRQQTQRLELANRKLDTLMNLSPIGIFQTNEKGQCIFVNQYWCHLTGLSKEEAMGDGWRRAIHLEDKERVFKEWENAVREHQVFSLVFRYTSPLGVNRWVHCQSTAVYNEEKVIVGFLGVSQDFTKQKSAEDKLVDARNFLTKVIDNLPVALFCKDVKLNFSFSMWNKKASEMWGLSEAEVVGKSDYDFFPKKEADFFRKVDLETMESGRAIEIPEETITSKALGEMFLHTKKVPLYDSSGAPSYLLGVSEDITERKRKERIIEEQRIRLIQSEKMTALGQMAAGVAHEINNPLQVIVGNAAIISKELRREKLEEEKIFDALNTVIKTCARISSITGGLRSFARDSSNDPFFPVLLKTVVQDTLAFCSEKFKNNKVDLTVSEIPDALKIECRESQLAQVLLNLLINALDSVETSSIKKVRVDIKDLSDTVAICISDSGSGVPETIRNKIFEPFFTTKPVGSGTGLGLSISKGIVESHHGTLTLEPSLSGAAFRVVLPKTQNLR